MNVAVNQRSVCRVCGRNDLSIFLEFSHIPLIDDYLTANRFGLEFLWPLTIYVCRHCQLVQTQHDVDTTAYYKDYNYSASLSPFVQEFMRKLARILFESYGLQHGDSVLEVGSSDGFQLECFKDLGARVFGYEPSLGLAAVSYSRCIPVAEKLFSRDTVELIPADLLPLKLIITENTFDHVSDSLEFLETVRRVLDPLQGLLVIEVHDLAKIIERREYCLFAHEHPVYYSVDTMRNVLKESGFKLLKTDLLPESIRRANSLLVVAAPEGAAYEPLTSAGEVVEPVITAEIYDAFGGQVEESLVRMRRFVQRECASGRRLAGYGAGGRGIMTLAMSGIEAGEMAYICDKNHNLHGYYTSQSHIPIVPPEYVLEEWVDEVIVFSFGYLQEIMKELSEYTARGGQLISLLELL